jgi:hypothetical protein
MDVEGVAVVADVADVETIQDSFMKSLDEKERMAFNIAKSHFGTMFSLEKSNAFLEWIKKK